MEQAFTKQCNLCGTEMKFKEGYNEAKKKAWKGYFCQNKDCKNVEWLKAQGEGGKSNRSHSSASGDGFKFEQYVAEEFVNINTRFDNLATYLKEKFDGKIRIVQASGTSDKEIIVKDIEF